MIYAPIIIPTLCRSDHFIRLIESLKVNLWAKYTHVYVSLDFPPNEKYIEGWRTIINYVDSGDFSAFAGFHVLKQKQNKGWVYNMWWLCDYIAERYDRWIYLEDDGECSPNFIEYIDKCLERYENDNSVYGVCGFNFPVEWKVSPGATCLKQNVSATVWGIGLWRDKYQEMRTYIKSDTLLDNVKKCFEEGSYSKMIDACRRDYIPVALSPVRRFNGFMRDWTDMSMRAFLAVEGKYCISPVVSKVRNWGFDGSGCSNGKGQNDNSSSRMQIDFDEHFELKEDTTCNDSENCKRLNDVDRIPQNQLIDVKREIWLYENYGFSVCKLYSALWATPKVLTIRAISRLLKIIRGIL